MEHLTFTQPNYAFNYSAIQMVLPLDLSISIEKSDPVVSFVEAVKEVNFNKYVKPISSNNTHSHSRAMLLKVILFVKSIKLTCFLGQILNKIPKIKFFKKILDFYVQLWYYILAFDYACSLQVGSVPLKTTLKRAVLCSKEV